MNSLVDFTVSTSSKYFLALQKIKTLYLMKSSLSDALITFENIEGCQYLPIVDIEILHDINDRKLLAINTNQTVVEINIEQINTYNMPFWDVENECFVYVKYYVKSGIFDGTFDKYCTSNVENLTSVDSRYDSKLHKLQDNGEICNSFELFEFLVEQRKAIKDINIHILYKQYLCYVDEFLNDFASNTLITEQPISAYEFILSKNKK